MSRPPDRRQELYDRIRSSSKDTVILEEMIRLGFWPVNQPGPGAFVEDLRRQTELERELRALQTEASRLNNSEHALKALRRQRILESRRRREETKRRDAVQRAERAEAWRARKAAEIVYLGPGVSGGLRHHGADAARLAAVGLPVYHDPAALAAAMGLSVSALRFLCYARPVTAVAHYVRFTVPKKTGGTRLISAPRPRLKAAQRWVLDQVLAGARVHPAAHGFVAQRSILSNARPHVGKGVVVNLDLKDFFPTVTWRRVRGLFKALGYPESVATVLALLCTEPEQTAVALHGATWYVNSGPRRLPQGAPTSPAITNLLCWRLDRRLSRLAENLGFSYTRYADDLSFSGAADADVGRLLRRVRYVVDQEGFVVHPDKTRIQRRGRQQEVTGIVVNDRPGVDRATLRRFRALLHQIGRDGPQGKRWGPAGADLWASAEGYASFVAMVDREKGAALLAELRALRARTAPRPPDGPPPPAAPAEAPVEASAAEEEKKPWWKLW